MHVLTHHMSSNGPLQSGVVDECGVCDGMSNSCSITMVVKMGVDPGLVQGSTVLTAPLNTALLGLTSSVGLPPQSVGVEGVWLGTGFTDRRRLAQDGGKVPVFVSLNVTGDGNGTAGPPPSAAYLQEALTAAGAAQPEGAQAALIAVPMANRTGVCGNKICEVGERAVSGGANGTCPKDCAAPLKSCSGGCGSHGTCMPASGMCQCWKGFAGPSCGDCAAGHVRTAAGVCIVSVVDLGLVNPSVMDASGVALVDTAGDTSSGLSAGAVAGIVIGCLAAVAALVAGVCCWRRRRAGGGGRRYADVEGGAVGYFDEQAGQEVTLREKFANSLRPASAGHPARYGGNQFHVHVDAGGFDVGGAGGGDSDLTAPLRRQHAVGGVVMAGVGGVELARMDTHDEPAQAECTNAAVAAWVRHVSSSLRCVHFGLGIICM